MNAEAANPDLKETLDRMGLEELRELRRNLDRAIASFEGRRRQQAISAAEQVAKEHGFKLAELVSDRQTGRGGKPGGSKSSAPAKYVNPDDPQQTWSGLGRRPSWVRAARETRVLTSG